MSSFNQFRKVVRLTITVINFSERGGKWPPRRAKGENAENASGRRHSRAVAPTTQRGAPGRHATPRHATRSAAHAAQGTNFLIKNPRCSITKWLTTSNKPLTEEATESSTPNKRGAHPSPLQDKQKLKLSLLLNNRSMTKKKLPSGTSLIIPQPRYLVCGTSSLGFREFSQPEKSTSLTHNSPKI